MKTTACKSNWNIFSDAAVEIFKVWVDGTELEWAERTWGVLTRAGLTSFETELERTHACLRLMTLGAIYLDFCAIVWDENNEAAFDDWAYALEVQPFQIGRIIQAAHGNDLLEYEAGTDEYDQLRAAYIFRCMRYVHVVESVRNARGWGQWQNTATGGDYTRPPDRHDRP